MFSSPIELGIVGALFVLLFGSRLLPTWGSALGETMGYIREKTKEKL